MSLRGFFLFPGLAALSLAAVLAVSEASAQTAVCQSILGELSSLGRGDRRAAAQADRARMQAERIAGYMASIGCGRQQVSIFGAAPPPECASLRGQLAQAQSNLASAETANGGNPAYVEQRRRVLRAALRDYGCAATAPYGNPSPRGPIESMFDGSGSRYGGTVMPGDGDGTEPNPDLLDPNSAPQPNGANQDAPYSVRGKPVCVRTCDGYFFPLDIGPTKARSDGGALCQALCPGAQTNLYFIQPGGEIESAVSADGQNYTALPSALRYRQSLQPGCACKASTDTWASLLKPAEELLGNDHSEDVVVTPEKSAEMSRPALPGSPKATAAQPAARSAPKPVKPDRRAIAKPPLTAGDQSQMNDLTVDGGSRGASSVFPPVLRGQN